MKIEGAVTAMISEYPFKHVFNNENMNYFHNPVWSYELLLEKQQIVSNLYCLCAFLNQINDRPNCAVWQAAPT